MLALFTSAFALNDVLLPAEAPLFDDFEAEESVSFTRRRLQAVGADFPCPSEYPNLDKRDGQAAHGDVCRNDAAGGWTCPTGCQEMPGRVAPFCVKEADNGSLKLCRVYVNPVCTPDFPLLDAQEVSWHGNVCRNPIIHGHNLGWNCPTGCQAHGNGSNRPYCTDNVTTMPCRAGSWDTGVFCEDTLGWNNAHGFDCGDYESRNWCANRVLVPNYHLKGVNFRYPSQNCCACGKV